jgi:pimeloyl-ACP methyl ester carboxylesterase
MLRRSLWMVALLLVLGVAYLLTTDNDRIWPLRNIAQYALLTGSIPSGDGATEAGTDVETASAAEGNFQPRPPSAISLPADVPRGELRGVVRSRSGYPIAGARVLISARDGTAFSAETDADGRYEIANVPVGSYTPVGGAPGFEDHAVRTLLGIGVRAGETTPLDVTLTPRSSVRVSSAQDFELSEPQVWQVETPIAARAVRRVVSFEVDGRPNQTTLFYTPDDGQTTPLPTLVTVYPGPADTWESVSIPLAQAGYAVIAVGPEYALDLEEDIDDLQRVIDLVNRGQFPRADGNRIGALGGSYSGLHVLRLAIRNPDAIQSILLLGPPTDAFELRRQYEAGTFLPPFGLDQALVALGLPDRDPERYWRYSARYHARSIDVPVMLIHSKADNVVPFTQSQLLADELERLGKPHELRIIEGMGHYLLATEPSPAIDELFGTTIGFFERTLR